MNSQVILFRDRLIEFFDLTRKTDWGKNEVIMKIKELYTEFLEGIVRSES